MAKAKKAMDPSAAKTTRSKKLVAAPAQSTTAAVTQIIGNKDELIRQRAYEIYSQRNGNGGSPEDDWFRAEAEILGRSA